MSDELRLDGDLTVLGNFNLSATSSVTFPNDIITDEHVSSSDPLDADKTHGKYRHIHPQAGTATTERKFAFEARAAGTLKAFSALEATACSGSSTVTVDLYVNGSSVLSAAITLNSSSVTNQAIPATISTAALSSGDYVETLITATQSGSDALATQVAAQVDYEEEYAS